jgi:hypothetical protein
MSAWHLPTIHMSIIRDGLVQHHLYTKEEADKLVKSWASMNTYALRCRYGDKLRPVRINPEIKYTVTLPALHKMLHCLKYQCSEGDTDTKRIKAWANLKLAIGAVADTIVERMPEEKNLPWAIFDKKELNEYPCVYPIPKEATAEA